MGLNPLQEKGMPIEKQFRDRSEMNIEPYNKNDIHLLQRCRK